MADSVTKILDNLKESIYQMIRCPITLQIMYDPVTASDGITYERQAIEKYLKINATSPISREVLGPVLNPAVAIKSIIDDYVKYYPDSKNEIYIPVKTDHLNDRVGVKKIFQDKNYSKLLDYRSFDLIECHTYSLFNHFLETAYIDHLKYFVDNVTNLEAILTDKNRLIHLVADAGRSEIVCYLLEKGVKTSCTNMFKRKPLHLIVEFCNAEAIRLIIDKTNHKNCKDYQGEYPTHHLMLNKKLTENEMIEVLGLLGNISKYNRSKKAPIHIACENQKKAIILYLMEHGAVLDRKDEDDYYPIHHLIQNTILSDDDKIEIFQKMPNLELEDDTGTRIIHLACLMHSARLIDYLLEKRLDLNIKDETCYPIHYLLDNENITEDEIVSLLPKFTDFEQKDSSERTVLHLACLMTKDKIIRYLLNQNVKLDYYDSFGYQPFHYYLKNSTINLDIVKLFVEKKVDINSPTVRHALKPIHLVARSSAITIMKYLLDQGAVVEDFVGNDEESDDYSSDYSSEESSWSDDDGQYESSSDD